jgi:hypothetical protein
MVRASDGEDEPRKESLEKLVRIESKVAEAAEAAATAAARAVDAAKAAEAASASREARKAKAAKTAKAAKDADTARTKAARAAKAAKAASIETVLDAPLPSAAPASRHTSRRRLELRFTEDEMDQIRQLAAEKGLSAPAFARSVLMRALARSDEG